MTKILEIKVPRPVQLRLIKADCETYYYCYRAVKAVIVNKLADILKHGHTFTRQTYASLIGPWVRDVEVSTKNSESKIELNTNYFTVKESGLYLVYAQVVYLTHAPNCYFVWARQPAQEPRLLTTCATGDDSSSRPLNKSQISCSVQTVTRLYKGDTVNIAQREQNRTLWLRPGYTYFGFVKLSS